MAAAGILLATIKVVGVGSWTWSCSTYTASPASTTTFAVVLVSTKTHPSTISLPYLCKRPISKENVVVYIVYLLL